MGDDARGDEARRRRHPGDDAARPRRPARPHRARQRAARDRARRRRRQVRRRGRVDYTRIAVGGPRRRLARLLARRTRPRRRSRPTASTRAADTLLLYFTSGTTARPKLVEHTHASYPVGHLSTMYWLGLKPGDVHLNISLARLGQARLEQLLRALDRRGDRRDLQLRALRRRRAAGRDRARGVTTFCAPPTVWRMLIQADLASVQTRPARGRRRRRAAQPRGHRAGPEGLGPDAARRLRPDRDDGADRQHARASRSSRARWAGRCRATRSRWSIR